MPLAMFLAGAGRGLTALAAASFGLTFFGSLLYWIRLFGNLAYVSLVAVQTLWVVAALLLARMLWRRLPSGARFLALPLGFLIGEFARSHLPWGGFGWGGLGYTQHDNLLALRLAPYAGVWGITLVILVVNSLLAEAAARPDGPRSQFGKKRLIGGVVLVLFPILLPVGQPTGERAGVTLIQGNVPGDTVDPNADDEVVLENHVRLTRGLDTPDTSLIVWPEGAFDRDPLRDPEFRDTLTSSIREARTPFLVGAILGTPDDGLRNASLLFDEDGDPVEVYVKQRLVPFGEFVPLRNFLEPWVKELARVPFDLVPGTERTVFTLPEGKFGVAICYESTYPDLVRAFVRRGAGLLVVSTNFSSYEQTAAADQHIAFSQLRAAEHRIWVAHAALSGKSAVVAPNGEVVERTGLFEPAVLTPEIRYAEGTTFYGRLGDWVPFAAMGLALMILLIKPLSIRLSEEHRAAVAPGEPAALETVPAEGETAPAEIDLPGEHVEVGPAPARSAPVWSSPESWAEDKPRILVPVPDEDGTEAESVAPEQGEEELAEATPADDERPALRLVRDDEDTEQP